MPSVFVFHGNASRHANAVFSTRAGAESWIVRHSLTGLLIEYDLDEPDFDRRLRDGSLPEDLREALKRGEAATPLIEQYFDDSRHHHYIFGVGEDSPDFCDASDRWNSELDDTKS